MAYPGIPRLCQTSIREAGSGESRALTQCRSPESFLPSINHTQFTFWRHQPLGQLARRGIPSDTDLSEKRAVRSHVHLHSQLPAESSNSCLPSVNHTHFTSWRHQPLRQLGFPEPHILLSNHHLVVNNKHFSITFKDQSYPVRGIKYIDI